MSQLKENKMGTESILKLIVTMSLPSMFSMLIQALYNVVDSIFLAQFSQNALTAVSLVFPLQMLMISIAVGTSVGVGSLVSRRLGEKRREEANLAATHGLILNLLSYAVVAILGAFFIEPFFSIYTQSADTLRYACDYTYIVVVFSFGVFMQISVEKTLQATGNMLYPMMFHLVGAITNLILDPILIFGLLGFPQLGAAGAAIATVIGQIFAMIFALIILFRKNHEISVRLRGFRFRCDVVRDIYIVGFPSILMQSIASVLTSLFNLILSSFSEAAITVLGVYFKLQSFVFMPVFGLTQGVLPIMGYSYGARNEVRLKSALRLGTLFSACLMVLGTLLFWLFTTPLLAAFNANEELLSIGIPALRVISTCFPLAGISIILSTLFQAVGKGKLSLYISILRQLVILLPAAYFLSKLGLYYIWFSFPLAECFSFVFALIFFRRLNRDELCHLSVAS